MSDSYDEYRVEWNAYRGEYYLYRPGTVYAAATVSYPGWLFRKLGHTLEGNIEKAICKIREEDRRRIKEKKIISDVQKLVNEKSQELKC